MTPTSHVETLFKVIAQPLTKDILRMKCNPNWANGSKKRRIVLRAFSLFISCFQFTIMHFLKPLTVEITWQAIKKTGHYENLWTRYRFNTYIYYDCNLFFLIKLSLRSLQHQYAFTKVQAFLVKYFFKRTFLDPQGSWSNKIKSSLNIWWCFHKYFSFSGHIVFEMKIFVKFQQILCSSRLSPL